MTESCLPLLQYSTVYSTWQHTAYGSLNSYRFKSSAISFSIDHRQLNFVYQSAVNKDFWAQPKLPSQTKIYPHNQHFSWQNSSYPFSAPMLHGNIDIQYVKISPQMCKPFVLLKKLKIFIFWLPYFFMLCWISWMYEPNHWSFGLPRWTVQKYRNGNGLILPHSLLLNIMPVGAELFSYYLVVAYVLVKSLISPLRRGGL